MLPWNDSAIEPTAHRFQVVLEHASVGVFQKNDPFVRSSGEERSQRTFQHRDDDTIAVLAGSTGSIPEGPGESLAEAA